MISASFWPRRPRISVAKAGWTYWSFVACSVIASMTRRSPWPMFTDISWLLKSRIRSPSGGYSQTPSARSTTIGSTAPWTDQEKKVCARLRATISSVVIAP